MLVKGIVSAVKDNKISVILPEYSHVTTGYLPVYATNGIEKVKVNDFVLVNFFNDDFNDGIVLLKQSARIMAEIIAGILYLYEKPTTAEIKNGILYLSSVEIKDGILYI